MNKLIVIALSTFLFSTTVLASGSISGTIGVSLTILPSVKNNECSNKMCAFDTVSIAKKMKNKNEISEIDYNATKKDNLITINF